MIHAFIFSVSLLSLAVLFWVRMSVVHAHSWVECTDYTMNADSPSAKTWQNTSCMGRPRCSQRQIGAGFGVDTGMNFQSASQCQCPKGQDNNSQIQKAIYKPGQRVCLAYPAKKNVAAECTNAYIPDNGVKISRTASGSNDDVFVRDYSHLNGQHVFGQIDYKGFQNCPNFCNDMDTALCTMCFDLEPDIPQGEYSFRWLWNFNSANDTYTTCWDAMVVATTNNQAGSNKNGSGSWSVNMTTDANNSSLTSSINYTYSDLDEPFKSSTTPTVAPTNSSKSTNIFIWYYNSLQNKSN